MNAVINFLLLTLLQVLAGGGLIALLNLGLKGWKLISLSALLGIALFSLVPFILQLFYIDLTAPAVFGTLILCALLLNLRLKNTARLWRESFRNVRWRLPVYQIPFLLVIGFIVAVSLWRCFYFPPTPRDLTSGAEVIAEYAVKEKTMINSVFTVNLESTNNQFKPPFITSLQIIYKYAGFPFGQVWLGSLFVFFLVFLYQCMRERLHGLMASFLLLIFLAIPEMYAYSFMALFDYPNAVFFFLSCYFLFEFYKTGDRKAQAMSGIVMGIAVYIRSETLILAGFLLLGLAWFHIRKWHSGKQLLASALVFFAPTVFIYLLSVTVYIKFYLPVHYAVEGLVNSNLLNPTPFFERFMEMNGKLIFSEFGVDLYGYFIFIFLLVIILDHIWGDGLVPESRHWIYAALVVYLGYPFLGYLLPLLDIDHSTKRGLFKLFPLLLIYMANSSVLFKWSNAIKNWEKCLISPS